MKVRTIAHQPAARDCLAPTVSCRHLNPRRERQDLFAAGEQETIRADKQRVHSLLDDVPESPLNPDRVAGIEEYQLHAVRARGSFHLTGLGLGESRVCRVAQVRDGPHPRDQNEQELEALRSDLGEEKIDAGEITAGMAETVDQADAHRVGALHEEDRDRAGSLFGRERSQRALQRYDHRYLTADQVGDQARHPIVAALPPTVFDGDVLTLDIASLSQSLMKIDQIAARLVPRCQVKESDHLHRRLLRARCERPRSCAAEQGDELPAPHSITSSASASKVCGNSRPSALAVLRLMKRTNWLGCNTGKSPVFSPLRIRPT